MNIKILLSIFCISVSLNGYAIQNKYSTYYYQRAALFEILPISEKDIVFLGNSITDGGEWCELFNKKHIKNRGISGDITMGIYERLDPILKGTPRKIFLMIGINDIAGGISVDSILHNIEMIIDKIKTDSPKTALYLQSILPVNDCYNMFVGHTSRWQIIKQINNCLIPLSIEKKVKYIDLYSHFVDSQTDKMKPEYSNDGLHLMGNGYLLWHDIILPYVKE